MSLAHASERPPPKLRERRDARVPLEFPAEEPFEDHVAETKRHLETRTALYSIIKETFADMTVGSDQFIYFDDEDPKRCLAPDVFVKADVLLVDFDSWKVWEYGTPSLAIEIVSATDRLKLTWQEKFERYHALGIRELVRFNAQANEPITVWDRIEDKLVQRDAPSPSGLYECKTLGLFWTVEMSADFGKQLRLSRDRAGQTLLPTPSEKVALLARELADERHARALTEHARMLAEQRERNEANARMLAEQRERDEANARMLAEQKQRESEAAHAAALSEIEHLRAELEQLRAAAK